MLFLIFSHLQNVLLLLLDNMACLVQLMIVIRSLIILCDHIWSKTRLIVLTHLIATLGIIYTSLHNCRLSWVSDVAATATTYKQDTGRGGRWGVVAAAAALGLCSVRNIGHPVCHHLLDRVHSLLNTDLQIPGSVVSMWLWWVSDTWLQGD